jgi:murein DD-endopeptidase MepM/ murein hydrolase activator NlpD
MSFRKKMKKEKNENNEGREKGFARLLDKEGFYIIMFLCVCIVGTVAVWVAKSNVDRIAEDNTPRNEEMNITDSEIVNMAENEIEKQTNDIIIIDQENESDEFTIAQDEGTTESINEENHESSEEMENNHGKILVENQKPKLKVTTVENNQAVEVSSEKAITMIWPVKGELGMGYAVETLTYSKTLEHYTTHHGIDILAEENTPIKAVLGGEVVEVLTDSRLGITISIDHGEGLITRYSNLCTDLMVNIGDSVTQGQTVSGVGTSSIFESAEGPHLHFEVLLNGKSVDPMKYLAEE